MSRETIDSLHLKKRDLAVLRGLFECRVMTALHIAGVFFDGKREYSKKRLQKMKAAGLVGERRRRVNEPAALFLTSKALAILNRHGILSEYPAFSVSSLKAR